MLEPKTKPMLAKEAVNLATSYKLVNYRERLYIPMHYETQDPADAAAPEETMWLPVDRKYIRDLAAQQYQTLFTTDSELRSYDYMVMQAAIQERTGAETLLVRTDAGLRELSEDGQLRAPSGSFVPNTVLPLLNVDQADKDRVWAWIVQILDSEEEAHSLLHHFATVLAPGWSAVKYVLMLGEGRNGKSLLMRMLQSLVGRGNVSHVTRQKISEGSTEITELNGKLLNIVFDGKQEYLKDSGYEKTLIAGEEVSIRLLYESHGTLVQTNALFVEGLNKEPKSTDKTSALQKRLVRFQFPNVYELDHKFERFMLNEKRLGALLSLLLDHFVHEDEVAAKLAPTKKAIELQLEHMFVNSVALQFLKYLEEEDPLGVKGYLGMPMADLVPVFQAWRIKESDLGSWTEPDVLALFTPLINSERKSQRVAGSVRKIRIATSLKPEAAAFMASLEGGEDDVNTLAELESVVGESE